MLLGCSLRHSERVRPKGAVPQEPRGIRGQLLGGSRDDHQAVGWVTKASLVEARIAGEKCDLPSTAQLRQDLSVGHSRAAGSKIKHLPIRPVKKRRAIRCRGAVVIVG